MKLFPPAPEPAAFGAGDGLLFWYGAEHVARAENSRRYRIENRLALLPEARVFVGRRLPPDVLRGVRVVLAVRPYVDRVARVEIREVRRRGIAVWADYDDLLFEGSLDDFPNARRFWARLRWRRRLPVYREGLAAFDGFTCTTEPIAEALRRARPDAPIELVPNVPSRRWIEDGWRRFVDRAWKPGDPLVLGYFPGSPSHDEDFAVVEETLARLLREFPELRLVVVGYLRFAREKFPADRLTVAPKVAYEDFPAMLLPTWLNLVPLADTPYSRARSDIKVLEAEAFDVPSAVGDASGIEARIRAALASGR